MTESDTEFLSRMLSQSSMPQGQAADPDMTRLLALAAEAVSLREALGRAVTLFRESRVAHHTTRAVNGDIPSAQIAIIADIDTDLFRAALKKESKE